MSKVPKTPETLASALEDLSVHDHLCLIYESQEEQYAAVVPFVQHGVAAGQRCIYIADDNTADALDAALRGGGIDVDAESARGALQILSPRESYLRDGRFDRDEMIAFLGAATAAAKADGFSALRVSGETPWVLGGEPGTARLFDYEAKLNHFLAEHDALAICQYDRSQFEPHVILSMIRTHPVVVSGDLVCDNFHYVPPDDFLRPDRPGREVDRLLGSIIGAEQSRQALEQASRHWSATFDAMNDMVCLLAPDGTVLRCNGSMVKLLGLDTDEVVGKKCYELMHGSHTFVEECPYQAMLRTGKRESFELSMGEHWYQVTADPLFGEAEEIVGAVHVVRDITARKETEQSLAREAEWHAVLQGLALDLAAVPSSADVGAFLATSLREATGAVASALSEYDGSRRELVTSAVVLEPGILERVARPLLKHLKDHRIAVSDEMYREMVAQVVDRRPNLAEPESGALPRAVSASVRKLLGTSRFAAMSYVVDGELLGSSLLALKAGATEPPGQFLEAFAHLAAVGLRRQRAEEQLRRKSVEIDRLFTLSDDLLVVARPDGTLVSVNPAWEAMLDCATTDLVDTRFIDLIHPEDRRGTLAALADVAAGQRVRGYVNRLRRRDGSYRVVQWGIAPYEGRRIYAVGRDVTEQQRAEAEIRYLNADLENRVQDRTRELVAANRELREFVYSVSHDLRGPLRAIDGFSFTVLEDYRDVIDEQGRSDLQRVRAAAQRMGQLIDALLSLSHVGHRELDLRPVDLSAIARRAIDELREADSERQVEIVIEDGLVAEADTWLVDVVLQNLLGNAWKFTAKRPAARIEFGSIRHDRREVFFVRDNGDGFDPVYVGKLFAPFQRLHTAEQFPGTGIGLAMVARALARLGGEWWAEGEVDRGATFFFTVSGNDADRRRTVE